MANSKSPGTLYAALRVFDLSLGEMLWSRRTIFMALVVGLPVLLGVFVRVVTTLGAPGVRMNGIAVDGPTIFGLMIWAFYLRFSIPVLGAFYGTALIADEVEDKTITYLFTRPIPRGAVLLGKYLAYLGCTVCVVLPSVVIVWMLVIPIGGSLGASFPDMVKDLLLLAIGLAIYGALFAYVGAAIKRPLIVGLVFIFGWEPAHNLNPAAVLATLSARPANRRLPPTSGDACVIGQRDWTARYRRAQFMAVRTRRRAPRICSRTIDSSGSYNCLEVSNT